jgi:hypothetical protein
MGSGDGADGRFIGTCSSHGIFVATLFGWTSSQCVLGCYTGTNSTILVVRVVHFNMSECLLLDLCWGRGGRYSWRGDKSFDGADLLGFR